MRYLITLKGFQASEDFKKLFYRYTEKLNRKLTNFASDLPKLSFYVKKHDKNHFFSGIISLSITKRPLVAHVGGHSAKSVINLAFEKILREFETYKGKRFNGNSRCRSIRNLIW